MNPKQTNSQNLTNITEEMTLNVELENTTDTWKENKVDFEVLETEYPK